MMTPAADVTRVMLATDLSRNAQAAFDAAISLARAWHAELTTLYIEDEDLINWAALPFAREISPLAPRGNLLSVSSLRDALERDATRVREAIAARAARVGITCSFTVQRGRIAHTIFEQRQLGDVVILSETTDPVFRLQAVPAASARILVATTDPRSLAIATQLAAAGDELMLWANHNEELGTPIDLRAYRIRRLGDGTPLSGASLAAAIALWRPTALVMSAVAAAALTPSLADTLRRQSCRLVLSP